MNLVYVVLILIAALAIYVLTVYNKLAQFTVKIKEAWSQIDIQLKLRADLIPNLVETVKGYAKHEKDVFENVTKARAAVMSATNPDQVQAADNMMTSALKSLFAVAENYPELKANENFMKLQDDLKAVEEKIAYARQFYNAVLRDYNNLVVTVPSSIIAKMFGFAQKEFFEASAQERQNVEVSFQ